MINLYDLDFKEENSLKYYYQNGEKYTGKAIWDIKEYTVEQELLEGLFHGNGIANYKTGEKYCEYYYQNGLSEGLYINFYKSNNIKSKINYEEGKINGEYILYYENGEIQEQFNYKKDILDGEFIKKYENGNIYTNGNYKEGKVIGKIISYFENGKLKSEKNYELGLLKEGKEYTETGKILSTIKTNENKGEEHTFYNDVGVITEITTYKGLETGIDAERFAERKLCDEEERIIKIENYKNYDLHGKTVLYYKNGNIQEERLYYENALHGSNKFYDELGNLEKEYKYKFGVLLKEDIKENNFNKN